MAKQVNVSAEELMKFSEEINSFSKHIEENCAGLNSVFCKVEGMLDSETGGIFASFLEKIQRMVQEKQPTLTDLESRVQQYAGFVTQLGKTLGPDRKNTPREQVAGWASGMVMRDHIQAADSPYQTVDAYRIAKTKTAVEVVSAAIEKVTGVSLKPALSPVGDAHVNAQFDTALELIDGQIALEHPERKIHRSGTPVPQKQIEQHTLLVNDIDDLWGGK